MADDTIAVKPARKGMGLVHPVAGPLRDEGGDWPADGFTFRRLMDKDIKRVEPDDGDADATDAKAAKAKKVDAKSDVTTDTPTGDIGPSTAVTKAAALAADPAPAPASR
jgi:hypothetical protein